jgi:hypothetical protein
MMFKMIVFNPLNDAVKLKIEMPSRCHLSIWPSGSPSPQKVLPFYEEVDSILRILKISVCVNLY